MNICCTVVLQSTVTSLVGSENASIFMINKSGQDLCLQLPSSNLFDRLVSAESNEALVLEESNKLDILSRSDIVFPGYVSCNVLIVTRGYAGIETYV